MALLYLCIFANTIYLNYYLTNRLSLEIKLYIKDIFQKRRSPSFCKKNIYKMIKPIYIELREKYDAEILSFLNVKDRIL